MINNLDNKIQKKKLFTNNISQMRKLYKFKKIISVLIISISLAACHKPVTPTPVITNAAPIKIALCVIIHYFFLRIH